MDFTSFQHGSRRSCHFPTTWSGTYLVRVHNRTRQALFTPDVNTVANVGVLRADNTTRRRRRGLHGGIPKPQQSPATQRAQRQGLRLRNMVQAKAWSNSSHNHDHRVQTCPSHRTGQRNQRFSKRSPQNQHARTTAKARRPRHIRD